MSEIIGATKIEKTYASKARENYAALLNEVAPKKLEDVIAGLEKHFSTAKGIELVQCDVCFGWSDEALDACPYCNDGKAEAPSPPPPAPVPSTDILASSKKKAATAPSILSGGKASLTEKDLDEELRLFREDTKNSNAGTYLMGKRLIRFRNELWMLRTAEGKPKYKSNNQFVEDELGMTVGYANKLRRIAEVFTLEQFIDHGPEALKALIAAPKEVHADLLKRHKEGATVEEIETAVKEIREKGGITVIETDATKAAAANGKNMPSAAATAAGAKSRKKDACAITIGLKSEQGTITCKARPSKKGEEPRDARTLEDQPFCEIEAINGVKLFLAIKTTPAGVIAIKYTAKREDDEKE